MIVNTKESDEYKKYFYHGKNKVYNRKLKIVNGKEKQRIILKEYKNILGSSDENIDSYNLDRKLNELKNDTFIKAIIEEKERKIIPKDIDIKKKDECIRKDNLIRSRNKVFDLARCNDEYWKSFITLTFKDNIQDVSIGYDMFNKWLKNVRKYLKKYNIDFCYLAVPEFQKRGALHYHILTNIECGTYIIPLQKGKENMYDVMYWQHGYSSAFNLVSDVDSSFDVAKYMCKYMSKENDDIRLKEHKRYYHSRNLKKPLELTFMATDINFQQIIYYLMNSCSYEIINTYHHLPKEKYEQEYELIEFEYLNSDEVNIFDIVTINLEF